jgi:hypothetical protein
MNKKLIVCLLVLITTKFTTVHAVTTNDIQSYTPPREKTISEIIDEKALQYNVSAKKLTFFLKCESSMNPNAKNISFVEASYGLSQINTLVHDVTIEQATEPEFAVNFMAENFSKGKYNMWYNCNQKWLKNQF